MPGRKKYAPPRMVVNAGRPLIFFRIGRFGIVMSNVPSCVPMIGSRSLPSSLNCRIVHPDVHRELELADQARAADEGGDPAFDAVSGAPSGSGGP